MVEGCREYQGYTVGGYGKILDRTRPHPHYPGKYRRTYLHRWVVEQVLGRHLRPDEVVRHVCDNPLCFLFDHLVLGTQADNLYDMIAKGRDRKAHGSATGSAKLTESQVYEIKALLRDGMTGRKIKDLYGVSEKSISSIKLGQTWKHVL